MMATVEPPTLPTGAPLLLIDCSGELCHAAVGTAGSSEWGHLETLKMPAVEGLHEACRRVLERAALATADLGGLVACDGPGGTIGLRITKTLVDVLQMLAAPRPLALFTYDSLAGAILAGDRQEGSIVCAGRRGHWFHRRWEASLGGDPEYFPDGTPPADLIEPVVQLRQRFGREPLYPGAQLLPPAPPPTPAVLANSGFLKARDVFIPFDPQAPEYVRWSGARHE